jgi:hypothetical protein
MADPDIPGQIGLCSFGMLGRQSSQSDPPDGSKLDAA